MSQIGITFLFFAGCSVRNSGEEFHQTKAFWHGLQRCSTRQEHLPYGWDVYSSNFKANSERTVAAWTYVTVCQSWAGLGLESPVGYQVVLYDPGHPMLFALQGDELQKYLDDNTALSVETTDIASISPMVRDATNLPREVYQGDQVAWKRDLEITVRCPSSCDTRKINIRRREWNRARLFMIFWHGEPHEI